MFFFVLLSSFKKKVRDHAQLTSTATNSRHVDQPNEHDRPDEHERCQKKAREPQASKRRTSWDREHVAKEHERHSEQGAQLTVENQNTNLGLKKEGGPSRPTRSDVGATHEQERLARR